MRSSTVMESSSYRLEWSVTTAASEGDPETLTLEYAIRAKEELYVTDRLWDRDTKHRRIPDPRGVYSFVRGESLRVVFAQAPWAPNLVPAVRYAPHSSRIAAGETRRVLVVLALPIAEYSALARDVSLATEPGLVSTVELVLGLRRRADMEAEPVPPLGENVEDAGYMVFGAEPLVSSCEVAGIPVLRRKSYMPRYALPGEPPPGPAPLPDPGPRPAAAAS